MTFLCRGDEECLFVNIGDVSDRLPGEFVVPLKISFSLNAAIYVFSGGDEVRTRTYFEDEVKRRTEQLSKMQVRCLALFGFLALRTNILYWTAESACS